jgi:hypothetical protein
MAERKRKPRPEPAPRSLIDGPLKPRTESLDTLILTTLLCGQTIAATAEILGVDRTTISRRLSDPTFRAQLEEARTDMLTAVQSKLGFEAMASVRVLAEIRDNERATWAARVRAADRLLRLAMGAPLIEVNQTTVVGGQGGPAPADRLESFLSKLQNRGTELAQAMPAAIEASSTEVEAPET